MAETAGTTPVHERLRGLVERVQGLPTLPSILHKLNQMILNPKTSAKEVSEVISSDPSLTSKVLRMANSPFYGFQNRITTITHANVILGFNTIKSIIMSSTIFDVFGRSGKSGALDRTELWKHSIGCGAAAKVIGHRLNYRVLEELLIAGLLHDVGKIKVPAAINIEVPGNSRLTKAKDSPNAVTNMIAAAQLECAAMKSRVG